MRFRQADLAHVSSAKRWAVLVCILLAGMAIATQALHLHPNDLANDAKHCPICHVAHAPAQAVPVADIALGLNSTAFSSFYNDPGPQPVLASFSLFCRPPPLS